MCSHREQARSHRALGAALAEEVADFKGTMADQNVLAAIGKAHLRAAEILESAHADLASRLAATPAPIA